MCLSVIIGSTVFVNGLKISFVRRDHRWVDTYYKIGNLISACSARNFHTAQVAYFAF
jgi:hypothetical protein